MRARLRGFVSLVGIASRELTAQTNFLHLRRKLRATRGLPSLEPETDWRFDDDETATYAPGASLHPGRRRGCSGVRCTDLGRRSRVSVWDRQRGQAVQPEEGDDLSPHALQEESVRDDSRLAERAEGAPPSRRHRRPVLGCDLHALREGADEEGQGRKEGREAPAQAGQARQVQDEAEGQVGREEGQVRGEQAEEVQEGPRQARREARQGRRAGQAGRHARQGPQEVSPHEGPALAGPSFLPSSGLKTADQSGYSSFRHARGSAGGSFGVRSSRKVKYGATNGSGAITVYVW